MYSNQEMQPQKQLEKVLKSLADADHYLFSTSDLQGVFGKQEGLLVHLSRAEKAGILKRVCRGIYLYPQVEYPRGRILFHTAALLRAGEFNYISLETALSDAGIISQIPINSITLMSSGRSSVIRCGDFGRIEFVHTTRRPEELAGLLSYDPAYRLWRASPELVLRDMRATRRNKDLINWEVAREFI
jgi:hypothetical protein